MTNKELIDKIRQEIETLDGVDYPCDNSEQEVGYHLALDEVGRFLDSLSVEDDREGIEPYNPVYDEAYLNEKIKKATESWKGVDVDAMLDECRGRAVDAPEVDLEKEIASFITQFGWGNTKHLAEKELINCTARHFAEWAFGQGHTFTQPVLTNGMGQTYVTFKFVYCESEVEEGEEVIVQIRKK